MRPSTELKYINRWEIFIDELEELQKIYFTFLKRWTVGDRSKNEPNKFSTYEKHSDEDEFELESEREPYDKKKSAMIFTEEDYKDDN